MAGARRGFDVLDRIEKALGHVVLRALGLAALLAVTVYVASYLDEELVKR